MEKILYCDMDGTLARFYDEPEPLKRYRTDPYFFIALKPYVNLIEALAMLKKEKRLDFRILSAVDEENRERTVIQKMNWSDNLFGQFGLESPAYYFPKMGTSKAEYIQEKGELINEDTWLLDDYSRNIYDWVKEGGRAIKALNGINGNGKKWKGNRINIQAPVTDIYNSISEIMGLN